MIQCSFGPAQQGDKIDSTKAQKINERVQLTSKFWSIEFSRALLDATQNELLLQNGICFEVAADERREISNDHNPEVSCTISFIFCALASSWQNQLYQIDGRLLYGSSAVALLWPFAKGSNLANYYTENMKAQLNLAPSQTQYALMTLIWGHLSFMNAF